MPVTTIEEVEIVDAFIHGTGDKNFTININPNRTNAGWSDWRDAINPEADYSSVTNADLIQWENERHIVLEARVQHEIIRESAKAEVQAIPNYATWTTSQAEAWLETNVTDLESAKVALKALAKMTIAMRNKLFPDLQE